MRILVVTPKILDDSLSVTTQLNTYATLSAKSPIHVVGRLRDRASWLQPDSWTGSFVAAPRIPGLNMSWFLLASPFVASRAIRRFQPDVVLTEPGSLLPLLLAASLSAAGRRAGICVDVRTLPLEGRDLRSRLRSITQRLALRIGGRRCDSMTAITPGAADWASSISRIPTDSVLVWGTGVDVRHYDPSLYPADVVPGRPIRFLYHGFLHRLRGLDTLVDAAAELRTRGVDFELTILGGGPDAGWLDQRVRELELTALVRVREAVPQASVPQVIAEHDVGVIPLPDLECWRTSSPTKLLECMAMARPVVLTSIPAHTDVAKGETYAVWANPGDAQSLSEAMEMAVNGIGRLREAALGARERIMAKFTWERQIAVLVRALEHAASLNRPA